MGFTGTLVDLPEAVGPCTFSGDWMGNGSTSVIYDISSQGVKAVCLNMVELFFLLSNWLVIEGARLLCSNRAQSHRRKLGLSGFPPIRKYRRSLIDVAGFFGASAAYSCTW